MLKRKVFSPFRDSTLAQDNTLATAPERFARPELASDEGGLYAMMDREETRRQLTKARTARVRMSAIRERIAEDAVRRRPPPSS